MSLHTPWFKRTLLCAAESPPAHERVVGRFEACGAYLVTGRGVARANACGGVPHDLGRPLIGVVVGIAPAVQVRAFRKLQVSSPDVLTGVEHVPARRGRQGLREPDRIEPVPCAVGRDLVIERQLLEADAVLLGGLCYVDGHKVGSSLLAALSMITRPEPTSQRDRLDMVKTSPTPWLPRSREGGAGTGALHG